MALGDQTRVVKLTINGSTEVTGSHTDYTVFINHDAMPSESLDADGTYPMNSDGGDIRVFTDSDLTTEIARDIIFVSLDNDPANSLFLMAVNVPSLTTSDKDIWVAYNDSGASDYGRTDTYGQDNAYDSNWKAFYPFIGEYDGTVGEVIDRTVNENHGTGGNEIGSRVPSRVSFGLLYGQLFDETSGDMILVPNSSSLNITGAITMLATVNRPSIDADNSTVMCYAKFDGTAGNSSYSMFILGNDKPFYTLYKLSSDVYTANSALTDDVTYRLALTWDGTTGTDKVKLYEDGLIESSQFRSSAGMNSHSYDLSFGTMSPTTYYNPSDITSTFLSIHNTDRSAGWVETYYNNESDIGNFITVGTPEAVGGAIVQRIIFID